MTRSILNAGNFQLTNPHLDHIVKPVWGYPLDFQLESWEKQAEILETAYPELSTAGLAEMAALWPNDHPIWEQSSVHPRTGESIRDFESLAVFPLPGKTAVKYMGLDNSRDFWEDVELGIKGGGLWGRLCKEILFPRFKPKFPVLFSDSQGREMGSDRFLPEDVLVSWFQELETIKGDFACRPIGFGRLVGYAVKAARWEIENVIAGIPGCTWIIGNVLLVNFNRLPGYCHLHFFFGCPGDRYRFGDFPNFVRAPCFLPGNVKGLRFASSVNVNANGCRGSVFLVR